jgi:hypothetical protein
LLIHDRHSFYLMLVYLSIVTVELL